MSQGNAATAERKYVPPAVLPLLDADGKPFGPGIEAAAKAARAREEADADHWNRIARAAYTLAPTVVLMWAMLIDKVSKKRRRVHTLFGGQFANLSFEQFCAFASLCGYDGVELPTWGDHFPVEIINHPVLGPKHIRHMKAVLKRHNLVCYAVSAHIAGQCVLDDVQEALHKGLVPEWVWGDGDPIGVRKRAAKFIAMTARAAHLFGVPVVNGFIGAKSWARIYKFPAEIESDVHDVNGNKPLGELDAAYAEFAEWWNPILDVFDEYGIKFALEVHPTEEGFSIYTASRLLQAIDYREAFGFNFDPSHLTWQKIDPVEFIRAFPNRIYHVHIKDAYVQEGLGRVSVIDHIPFTSPVRSFNFRSLGRGNIDFEPIINELCAIGYVGPLSIEWEDSSMQPDEGAIEARTRLLELDHMPSTMKFDGQFDSSKDEAETVEAEVAAEIPVETEEVAAEAPNEGDVFLEEFRASIEDRAKPVAEQAVRFEQLRFIGSEDVDAAVAGETYEVPTKVSELKTVAEAAVAAFDEAHPGFFAGVAA